ncbi:MAG: hypothetical protein HY758_06560, partial [Nitrospirae bacterium]|nr:hypothetical protein [Nitrospirota bacterium]
KYPLSVLLGFNSELKTAFGDLKNLGYPVLSWTQSRPAGPMHAAVTELQALIKEYRLYAGDGMILICHSRGGLIARKYMEKNSGMIRGLITLATPHHGTSMAKWVVYLSPLSMALNKILNGFNKKDVDSALQRILGFLSGNGLKELLPGSKFLEGLKDRKQEGTKYVSIGGTSPDLLKAIAVSLPAIISRVMPHRLIPEEMKEGSGDGLVSAASAVLPFGDEHKDFHVNHASILFDREVREYILRSVEKF